MRRISAQYVFTSAGKPLRRGVVTAASDGTILSVEDTGGDLAEKSGTEFYNGIIIPGLVNCHSHLELSHMRNTLPAGGGLTEFINGIRQHRDAETDEIVRAARDADNEMYREGVVASGDISNNSLTFDIKSSSAISYLTFIEVFGLDPLLATERIALALELESAAGAAGLTCHITPHAVYSVSQPLFSLIKEHIRSSSVTSLHFLESDDERKMAQGHLETAITLSKLTSQLILVHNTVLTEDELEKLVSVPNIWFCLCPSSNMRISGKMPPVGLLAKASGRIVVGTDSLASTGHLSILGELILLHADAPGIPLDEIIRWGTISGARALEMDGTLGSIEPGKKPGLLLIEEVDLARLHLLPESRVRRLL
jgi:cytosine/adenosine deaminase-related metal-dependent hydrolase